MRGGVRSPAGRAGRGARRRAWSSVVTFDRGRWEGGELVFEIEGLGEPRCGLVWAAREVDEEAGHLGSHAPSRGGRSRARPVRPRRRRSRSSRRSGRRRPRRASSCADRLPRSHEASTRSHARGVRGTPRAARDALGAGSRSAERTGRAWRRAVQCKATVSTARSAPRMYRFACAARSSPPSCQRLRQIARSLLSDSLTTAVENDSNARGPS